MCPCTGGKPPAAAAEAEDGSVGKKGKQKVSRKERIQRKRDQKRAERQAGSDDEDLGRGAGAIPHGLVFTTACHGLSTANTLGAGFAAVHWLL